jgi:NAD(P)-dependent dehydrogenase (short-subunit alcohol dehydrogenase family)
MLPDARGGTHIFAPMPKGAALVTGAGGGLGLAIARRLAGRGHTVAVTDIDGDAAQAAAEQIGRGAWGSALDVRDLQACRIASEEAIARGGSLEVWVNNAGILLPGVIYEQEMEAHRAMLEVNAVGTFNGTLAAIEKMRAADRGHLINIISLAGLVAAPGVASYAASKHAAMAFTLGTLTDLRRMGIKTIQVSAVCPDGIWSPMIMDKLDDRHDAASFSGKMMMPDEVAAEVEKLLDRPKAVLTIPRWRGHFVRWVDRHPDLAARLAPFVMRDAERRQRRFKRRVEAGKWPPAGS